MKHNWGLASFHGRLITTWSNFYSSFMYFSKSTAKLEVKLKTSLSQSLMIPCHPLTDPIYLYNSWVRMMMLMIFACKLHCKRAPGEVGHVNILISIDSFWKYLMFVPARRNEIYDHNLKKHLKISKIAKFDSETL